MRLFLVTDDENALSKSRLYDRRPLQKRWPGSKALLTALSFLRRTRSLTRKPPVPTGRNNFLWFRAYEQPSVRNLFSRRNEVARFDNQPRTVPQVRRAL